MFLYQVSSLSGVMPHPHFSQTHVWSVQLSSQSHGPYTTFTTF